MGCDLKMYRELKEYVTNFKLSWPPGKPAGFDLCRLCLRNVKLYAAVFECSSSMCHKYKRSLNEGDDCLGTFGR